MFSDRASAAGQALLGVIAFYAAVVLVALPLGMLIPLPAGEGLAAMAMGSVPLLVGAVAVNWVFVARGWTRWATLGWRGRAASLHGFVSGVGVGVGMAGAAVVLAVLVGDAQVELTGEPVLGYVEAVLALGGVLAIAALGEELLFRGYPLARLAVGVGRVPASLALALLFALAHLWNPEVSALGLVNIGLAALVLSAAFFTPGGLPAAWGVHLGWNGGLALGADAPVSGLAFDVPLLDFTAGGPEWLTGGAFGPEGGVAATAAMGLALVWLARRVTRAGERAAA